jgi:hypothetical protein
MRPQSLEYFVAPAQLCHAQTHHSTLHYPNDTLQTASDSMYSIASCSRLSESIRTHKGNMVTCFQPLLASHALVKKGPTAAVTRGTTQSGTYIALCLLVTGGRSHLPGSSSAVLLQEWKHTGIIKASQPKPERAACAQSMPTRRPTDTAGISGRGTPGVKFKGMASLALLFTKITATAPFDWTSSTCMSFAMAAQPHELRFLSSSFLRCLAHFLLISFAHFLLIS